MSSAVYLKLVALLIHLCSPADTEGQNGLELTATANPSYNTESVLLDFPFPPGFILLSAEITAYQGQELIGYLRYNCVTGSSPLITGTGVFYGRFPAGCGVLGATVFGVYFIPWPYQNFDVNATAMMQSTANFERVTLSSNVLNLIVLVRPGPPQFSPSPVNFNAGFNVTLSCSATGGIPEASLVLEIRSSQSNELLLTASGIIVVSATWTMSEGYHKAVATCRVTNHLRFTQSNTTIIWQSGPALLTFSSNPVYENATVTLSCYFQDDCSYNDLCLITIVARNGTLSRGLLTTDYTSGRTNATGIFSNSSVIYDWNLKSVGLSFKATRYTELDYYCTTYNYSSIIQVISETSPTRLAVNIAPSLPALIPRELTFIDNDPVTITCRTVTSGKPAAILQLLVNSTQQSLIQPVVTGTNSISTRWTISRDWHGAKVSCSVLNHIGLTLFTSNFIKVVHLATTGNPDVAYTYANDTILDCASYVVGFPDPSFQWLVPTQWNFSDIDTLNGRYLLVGKNQSGSFKCTATNPITRKNVTVNFAVNDAAPVASVASNKESIIGGTAGSLATVTTFVIIIVIVKRTWRRDFNLRFCARCLNSNKRELRSSSGPIANSGSGNGYRPPENRGNVDVQPSAPSIHQIRSGDSFQSQSFSDVVNQQYKDDVQKPFEGPRTKECNRGDQSPLAALKNKLKAARTTLVDRLDFETLKQILDHFVAARNGEGLITRPQLEHIESMPTRADMVRAFLDVVESRGNEAINLLVKTLRTDCNMPDLAELLR